MSKEEKLLTRDAFQEGVFMRDGFQCVVRVQGVPNEIR
jgi:hypothetical protein